MCWNYTKQVINFSEPYFSSTTVTLFMGIHIKTHDSELQGQEEEGRARRTSELFTGSTAVKLVNALNKLPLKLLLSYQGLSTLESVTQQ